MTTKLMFFAMFRFALLLLWGAIWIPIWILSLPWKRGRENCLTWVLHKWVTEGGYIAIRWCRHNKSFIQWPHFLWLPEEKHEHLQHIIPKYDVEKHYFPSPWFDPKFIQGDPDNIKDN